MLRSFLAPPIFAALLLAGIWSTLTVDPTVATQNNQNNQSNAAAGNQNTRKSEKNEKIDRNQKTLTAEQVAELTVLVYGSRPVLAQIRRNGVERGRITRFMTDGKTEEATYERRFVTGESADKDKIRLDQKMPTMEYSLIFGEGRLWGVINGAFFKPRQETADDFLSQHRHSVESMLRYKENGATINMVGKDKQKGLDLYILDLTDKDKRTTRYYISARTFHVLWLEYEEAPSGAAPLKYSKRFSDYRYAQSTLVPYRTILMEDGRQTQETRILTVTFGVKVDDALFKNPQA
ncbi:MAG: outer membrane lipoprotein-sorting protein [Acidobacteriota bacterium]|nr:outer membrane lipoprotein-sorting protein [Acidobacteriota bacterium]